MLMMVALGACEKEIYYEDIAPDPLLVVNGIQHVGEPARLYVEKTSFYIGTDHDFRVKDVKADLYVNGVFKESLQVRDSLIYDTYIDWNDGDEIEVEELKYAFNYCEGSYLLCEGDELRFEVSSSEFEEVAVAETTMPYTPNVVSFDTLRIERDEFGLRTAYFTLTLDDPAGKDFYNLYPQDGFELFVSTDPVFTDFMDVAEVGDLFGTNEYYGRGPINIFTDAYFDGTRYAVTMEVNVSTYNDEHEEPYTLEVTQVDESFYQYEKTLQLYQSMGGMSGIFTEPAQVYTNVQNGVGVVAGQGLPVVRSIDLSSLKN